MNEEIAVVTGGANGIGLGVTKALLESGYKVAMFDINDQAIQQAQDELKEYADALMGVRVDVTSSDDVKKGVEQVSQKWKTPDILVNNAGIARDKRITKMTEEDWDFVINVNLKSQFLCVKEVIPGMIEQKYGRIVNISSRAWLGGFGQANYSAAKGGVVSLTRSLAIELAKEGITANAIAPGIVETPLFNTFKPEVKDRLKASVPVGRIGQPEDIAQAILFFIGKNSSYITGQTLYVCGGRSLSSPSV